MASWVASLVRFALRIDQETDQLEIQEEAKTIVNADRRSFIEAQTSVLWVKIGLGIVGKVLLLALILWVFNMI